MRTFITEIISRFGGRIAGTNSEKEAQEYTRSVLENYCTRTHIQEFESSLDAHFESLKIFCVVYLLNLALYKFLPTAAVVSGLVSGLLFLGHFVGYRPWLDFLYPKKKSWNAMGVIEPTQAAKATLVIAGHIDSVHEFTWWYRFKEPGAILTVVSSFLVALQGLLLLVAHQTDGTAGLYIWAALLALSPLLLVLYNMHDKAVKVDGASDNLTGVAMAVEMAKVFSEKRLQHTRLKLVSFGSEEPGLKGSMAFANEYQNELKQENAVLVNLDTIKDKEHLSIVKAELNSMVFYDGLLNAQMEAAFARQGVPVKGIYLSMGVSDGTSFRLLNLPAISIIGMNSSSLDPVYHTRLDNLDNLPDEGMAAMKAVLVDFIEAWDKQHQ